MTAHSARHLIDGAPLGDAEAPSIAPATGETLGRFADAGEAEVASAIRAARTAFDTTGWSRDRRLRHRLRTVARRAEAPVLRSARADRQWVRRRGEPDLGRRAERTGGARAAWSPSPVSRHWLVRPAAPTR